MFEARSELHETEAAHAASKAEFEARVSNALSGARAETALTEAQARANVAEATSKRTSEELMERCELEPDLATKFAEAEYQLSVLEQVSLTFMVLPSCI